MIMNPIWHRWWTRSQMSPRWSRGTPKSTNCSKPKSSPSKDKKKRYNEFEHLPLNHIRLFQKKVIEEEKLQFFTSLFREDAIEFWQTIRRTPETTLREVLQISRKKYARDDLKEVWRYRWDQLKYDPKHDTFSDFLKHLRKIAKQAFDSKANENVTAFLFGKLPVAIQNDLSVAGVRFRGEIVKSPAPPATGTTVSFSRYPMIWKLGFTNKSWFVIEFRINISTWEAALF